MCSVLAATWAELRHFETVWVVATVLLGDVVTFLAVHACERDLRANVRALACHGSATSRAAMGAARSNKKHAVACVQGICSGSGARTRDLTIMSRAL